MIWSFSEDPWCLSVRARPGHHPLETTALRTPELAAHPMKSLFINEHTMPWTLPDMVQV